ncbi:DBH-like monooxygenase protein 1 [Desmophyllum pertusum]|uniref:DBH-like monooxygenase protein 1 n=1 Tax=Desmophyllum pertusum TaxID=174260 RepID=A0A9W9Z390_9CNID|nr:DBH-like monooxygenase protein 1 [Desmophyllum pertusum]
MQLIEGIVKTMETLTYVLLICMHLTKSSADLRASGHSFFASLDQDENVKLYWNDRHGTGHVRPQIDSQQDYELISLEEDSGKTIMKFKRKLETCDPQDNKIQEGTTKLIYAFHTDDPSSENDIPQHDPKSKGARSTYLLNSVENVPKLPDDTKTFNFTNNKRVLSTNELYTRIVCLSFQSYRKDTTLFRSIL